ncbi:hypothetical protein HY085_00155 [Candidatus Gottesmanbacteria bacterium]|nr:hypothetical protein [Candidatus Gottesmanbacteria bacterium]
MELERNIPKERVEGENAERKQSQKWYSIKELIVNLQEKLEKWLAGSGYESYKEYRQTL